MYPPSVLIPIEEDAEEEAAEEKTEDSVIFAEYTPKATFTSVGQMEARIPDETEDSEDGGYLGEVNAQFLNGSYYTGDVSTPFLSSFAERWNRAAFLRRFANAEELFERVNYEYDTIPAETIRGEMPMLADEYQLAFRNRRCQAMAKSLVRRLTTLDYDPEQLKGTADSFAELVEFPYDTPEFLSSEERDAVRDEFWTLYDKSAYVPDYDEILSRRLPEEVDYDELYRESRALQDRYLESESFDAKCIYALEMACYGFPEQIDYLGELIEDGRYSKYLFEVWASWRRRVQQTVFGVSSWSEIPDNLYDNARLLVAEAYVKHILEEPSDTLARLLLMNLIFTDSIHRSSGNFGNECLGASEMLRTDFFIPQQTER